MAQKSKPDFRIIIKSYRKPVNEARFSLTLSVKEAHEYYQSVLNIL